MQRLETDVLIVGAGLAGLVTALATEGRRVTLLCAWAPPGGGASAMAQGGIAAAVEPGDSPWLHLADTLLAGAGECDLRAALTICEEGPSAVRWLERKGVRFDRCGDQRALHREAAHSRARVLHVHGDGTGFALTRALTRAASARPDIEILSGHHAVALATGPDGVRGVVTLDRNSRPCLIRASETVIATGGVGQLFSRTTNPPSACGDGLAMALAAGARCAALEYLQFHPTALDVDSDPMPLITEALRGAGAKLIDEHRGEFMRGIHAAAALAPRDIVAREVWKRICAGSRVYLDATALFDRDPTSFAAVRRLCASHGIDAARAPIPVAPAAHFHMGGIAVDLEGRSSLGGLWACGEVACTGAHGANRLASNSLLEAVVIGRRLGRALTAAPARGPQEIATGPTSDDITLEVDASEWSDLRRVMWTHAGIVRDEVGLEAALRRLRAMAPRIPAEQIRLRNRVRLASAIVTAALAQRASHGAHFRCDVPPDIAASDPVQSAVRRIGG